MDIKEYSYILAVVDKGGISEAAKSLYISQPSLSMYIKKLEERVGFKFFHKSDGKLYLTDMGKTFIDYARRITVLDASLHKALANTRSLNGGQIVMGVTTTRSALLLPMVLPIFKASYPNIDIQIIEATSSQLEKLVLDRQVDLAVMNKPEHPMDLEALPLSKEEIVVAIPHGNPAIQLAITKPGCPYDWIELSALRDQPFVLMKPGQRMRQAADRLFEQAGYSPKILLESQSAMTAYQLALAGTGLFIITDSFLMALPDPRIHFFSVGDPCISYQVIITYPSEEGLSGASKAMIAILQDALGHKLPRPLP